MIGLARGHTVADNGDQLPAVLQLGALATPADTYIVSAQIADAGDADVWRYIEFFTANIGNPHTRRAYARAGGRFSAWCEDRGVTTATPTLVGSDCEHMPPLASTTTR